MQWLILAEGDVRPKNASVCANIKNGTCCDWKSNATIQWCGGLSETESFYVYKLESPPDCKIAYCAGDHGVCAEDEYMDRKRNECVPSKLKLYPVFNN